MSGRRKVTLSDVAEHAGVSPTTASYILNGRSAEMRISADAERRVREAAASLRYRPNRSARTLRSSPGRNAIRTIAVVSDHLAGGAFATRMLDGARTAARAYDHLLIVGETGGEPEMEVRVIEEMLDRHVDGIVFATLSTHAVSVPPLLLQAQAVLLNCVDPVTRLRAVLPDELAGGTSAAELVLEALAERAPDHARVWLVGDDEDPSALAGPLRQEGLCRRLRSAGIEIAGVVRCAWAVVAAYDAVSAWLATDPRPDVLVCLNDRIAMGTYQALQEAGRRIPEDVAVVSFDGSELATWLRPALTSVTIPYEELGALAVRVLLDPAGVPVDPDGASRVPMPVMRGRSIAAAGVLGLQ